VEKEKSFTAIITGEENDILFYGLCAAAAALLVAIIVLCVKCRKKGKIVQHTNQDSHLYPANVTNERSLHLEEMDEEDYKNPNETNRPSLGGKGKDGQLYPQEGGLFSDGDKLPKRASYKKVKSGSQMTNKEEGTEDPDDL